MSRLNNTTKTRKGKHLNYEDRIKIEALSKAGIKPKEIGELLGGRSERTIYRELKQGTVELLNSDLTVRKEYSADVAQQKHDYKGTAKGPGLKIANDYELVDFIEKEIKEKSPYAVAEEIKQDSKYKTKLCYKTIYNYIDQELFPTLTNKDLPVKKDGKKRNYHHIRTAITNAKGTSISDRPEDIDTREEYGHWEMDTVVGKQGTKTVLLVLTERKTRQEMIFKMASKSQECVVRTLDKLERKMGSKTFRETFITITCDNGCENLDFEGIEKSCLTTIQRTQVYYAHPYSAWERGSNEIAEFSLGRIKMIENWINNYPRRIFNGLSANALLKQLFVA